MAHFLPITKIHMAKQIIRKDMGYLGPDFQEELVKCFIEDPGRCAGNVITTVSNKDIC